MTFDPLVNIYILDICLPDYFRGHSLPVGAIPLEDLTPAEFVEEVRDDFYIQEMYHPDIIEKAIDNFLEANKTVLYVVSGDELPDELDDERVMIYYVIGSLKSDEVIPGLNYVVNAIENG